MEKNIEELLRFAIDEWTSSNEKRLLDHKAVVDDWLANEAEEYIKLNYINSNQNITEQLDKWIDESRLQAESFKAQQMSHSEICSESMAAAYLNVKNYLRDELNKYLWDNRSVMKVKEGKSDHYPQ